MKPGTLSWLLALTGLWGQHLAADPFDCGSTGAYGPMNITSSITLDLPPDGIFHCTTITISDAATVSFNRNALNTPVYLLATGDVLINGSIDVSGSRSLGPSPGLGGPGGFDGGHGGAYFVGQDVGGDGHGPCGGASGGGSGHFAGVYGNILLDPLVGGSGGGGIGVNLGAVGGGPGEGGGGGGGAVLIASNSRIRVIGGVYSNGAFLRWPIGGGGSGGAVRLVAPVVEGTGTLSADRSYDGAYSYGGFGRVRIDCFDDRSYRALAVKGAVSRGSRMIVFSPNPPCLDIIEVAGNAIFAGTNNAGQFELLAGAPTNQTVRVQARNFTKDVPIRVVVTPEHGPRGEFDAMIQQASGNPPYTDVPVIIPAGSVCQIHAWTR